RFVAVSTSLVDARGERPLGWSIGPGHPAYAALQKGETWAGRGLLLGRSFEQRVQPVRDLQERIVGALYIAFDLADFDSAIERRGAATGQWGVGEASGAEALRGQWRALAPFLALFGAAAFALVAGLYVLLRRRVGRPLAAVTSALERVAAGDLSQPVLAGGR